MDSSKLSSLNLDPDLDLETELDDLGEEIYSCSAAALAFAVSNGAGGGVLISRPNTMAYRSSLPGQGVSSWTGCEFMDRV